MYFVPCTKYILSEKVSIHQFLGCCSVNCHPKIDCLVIDQKFDTVENFESMDSQYIKHLAKATEYRSKEDCQAAYGVPIPDHVMCSILTKNSITLDHPILKNWIVRGYSGYQNLVGMVDSATVGEFRK